MDGETSTSKRLRSHDDASSASSHTAAEGAVLGPSDSLRLRIEEVFGFHRPRRMVVGFVERETATVVCKSWRVEKNQQTIHVKCSSHITDAAVIALATHCAKL
eukprot:CAMPEP_0205928770 /NCGR_PEP_ID=MMETSP1325-20131115/24925_1 /ASSEMBLY_ACC=CAM_ASM_000708 /TAXON_ID=236786 /ORGANISM="Florenciella sp., Strain RCC1007" /LENGTH=102 /DNA_ID=CAMNT_0053297885 /DNA_START=51 /DNA_END=355 /DNA_ORIENTATION=+